MRHVNPGPAVAGPAAAGLRQSLPSGDELLEWLPVGLYSCDAAGRLLHYNRRAVELWGRSPRSVDGALRYCGACKAFRPDGAELARHETPMAEMLASGEPIRDRELMLERPDGTRITVLASLDPLFDEHGALIGGVNCFQDITAMKRAEAAGRQSERRLHDILDALPAAIYTTDADGRITFYNRAATEFWGWQPELGDPWCGSWRLYWPDGRHMPHDQCPMAVTLKENRAVRGAEAIVERPDGTRFPMTPFPTPLRDERGALAGGVNMLVDISERKRAELRQKLLIDELNHRVKNTLATVQSLALVTAAQSGSQADFLAGFQARLAALSKAHDQLTRRRWKDADLRELIETELAACCDDPHRISFSGAETRLRPSLALTFAMLFHELATNALEYGALSVATGTVAIAWQVRGGAAGVPERLEIDWHERGGPPVTPPRRRGFGSLLLERSLRSEHGGSAGIDYHPEGVHVQIGLPLETSPLDWTSADCR